MNVINRIKRLFSRPPPPQRNYEMEALLARGFKGYPDDPNCQCYPECRIDCPDHVECKKRLYPNSAPAPRQ